NRNAGAHDWFTSADEGQSGDAQRQGHPLFRDGSKRHHASYGRVRYRRGSTQSLIESAAGQLATGLNFANVMSSVTSSKTISTGMPARIASFATSTRFVR